MSERSEWIEWNGGECPVSGDTVVAVKFRDGGTASFRPAHYFNVLWRHAGMHHSNDIVAYQVVKQ